MLGPQTQLLLFQSWTRCLHPASPLKTWGIWKKHTVCNSQSTWKQHFPDITRPKYVQTQSCGTRPAETHASWGCSTEQGKWTWGPTQQRSYCNWQLLVKGKAVFHWVSLGTSITPQGRPTAEDNFSHEFLLISLCFGIFSLISLLRVLIFKSLFWKRERT